MDKVIPRNNPSDQSMTQDNVVKGHFMLPDADNLMGNESGVSDTAGRGTTSGESTTAVEYKITPPTMNNSMRPEQLNITASPENRSAKWKNGEGRAPWDAGAAEMDNGQYLGR